MKKVCFFTVLVFLHLGPLAGCNRYTVTTSQKNPADLVYKKTVAQSYFWGIINKPHTVMDTTCGNGGLSEVKVTSSFAHSLLHVVSLGTVHLVRIEYKCQKEPPVIGHQP